MNNFSTPGADATTKVPRHLETLVTTVFQSLFPPINPQTTPLKSIKRVLLLDREPSEADDGTFILSFRHYAITTKATGLSKPLKRLNAAEKLVSGKGRKGGVPNLGKLEDIADFMIGGENGEGYATDYTSGSEVDTDAEVEVVDDGPKRVSHKRAEVEEEAVEEERVEKRAVKMVELGPRMRLRLTKVEEGLAGGRVMWHEYIHKTQEEAKELEARWERKRAEKERRKKEQKANLERKRAEKKGKGKEDGEDEEMEDVGSELDADDFYNSGLSDVDGGGPEGGDDMDEGEE